MLMVPMFLPWISEYLPSIRIVSDADRRSSKPIGPA
jgi:hypothetical protein